MLNSHRLTGGYASSNFAAVLKPPGDAAEFTAVLKFSYAAMPREEIEHQLTVLRALEHHGFATNYLLPKLAAAPDAGLCDRYLVTAEDGGGPWVILVTFCAGTAGDKLLAAANEPVERAMLESLGASLAQLHTISWEAGAVRDIRCGYPVRLRGLQPHATKPAISCAVRWCARSTSERDYLSLHPCVAGLQHRRAAAAGRGTLALALALALAPALAPALALALVLAIT